MLPRDTIWIAQHAGEGGCDNSYKGSRNVPVIGSWRALHVSVILVGGGEPGPSENKKKNWDEERNGEVKKRSSGASLKS